MKENKVSVVIPVYNVEKYLAECLESVIRQTLKELEIICVNDGSRDRSAAILEKYAAQDDRIKIITTENHGLSAARNTGMSRTTGKYLFFLDSDDMLEPEALEQGYRLSEQFQLDILHWGARILRESSSSWDLNYKRPPGYCNRVMTGRELLKSLQEINCFAVNTACFFFRTAYIKENQFFMPEGIIHEDKFFSAKALIKAPRVYMLEEEYYIRRVRSGSIMTGDANEDMIYKHGTGYFTVYNLLCKDWESGVFSPEEGEIIEVYLGSLENLICIFINKLPAGKKRELFQECTTPPAFLFWVQSYERKSRELRQTAKKLRQTADKLRQTTRKLKRKNAEIQQLKSSASYQTGQAVTLLPRMALKTWRCLKENGVWYTLKRLAGKFPNLRKKFSR